MTVRLLLHGGAGVHPDRAYPRVEAHLGALVAEGKARLLAGAAALDVVEWAVGQLEESGLYVAGRGSAPNRAGWHEFDASIMDGAVPRAGAVACLRGIRSPIAAARAVMERTPHLMLAGEGASSFARAQGLAPIPDEGWFMMPEGVTLADIAAEDRAHGTVGAVALDGAGRLAVATSTGGTFGKEPGRVGDTPLIGVGSWADGQVAASCTGIGEAFILAGGAGEIGARMRLAGEPVAAAAAAMLDRVRALGGDGGVIALDRSGAFAMPFNSGGMKRAVAGSGIETSVRIVGE